MSERLRNQRIYDNLTSRLYNENRVLYEYNKITHWSKMIMEGLIPVKFYKASKDGTRVEFKQALTNKELRDARNKLCIYTSRVKAEVGFSTMEDVVEAWDKEQDRERRGGEQLCWI